MDKSGLYTTAMASRLTGIAAAILATLLYRGSGGGWTRFSILLLLPDLTMLAQLTGPRWGSVVYNLAHNYPTPVVLGLIGVATETPNMTSIALVWGAHIGIDRALGFGLVRVTF